MPTRAPNFIQPQFRKNLDALQRTSPTLHALLEGVLALNAVDDRLYVSTATNAHIYLGRSFLSRVEFHRDGSISICRDTDKEIAADATTERAPEFYRGLIKRIMDVRGFPMKWAEEDRLRGILTLRATMPDSFVPVAVGLFRGEIERAT